MAFVCGGSGEHARKRRRNDAATSTLQVLGRFRFSFGIRLGFPLAGLLRARISCLIFSAVLIRFWDNLVRSHGVEIFPEFLLFFQEFEIGLDVVLSTS